METLPAWTLSTTLGGFDWVPAVQEKEQAETEISSLVSLAEPEAI